MVNANTSAKLMPDYASCMAAMRVRRVADVTAVADKLLRFVAEGRYEAVSRATGVPQIWMATSFEREASSDFRRSPAQGDFWNAVSKNVPRGRGPFSTWAASAIDAYHLNGLDKVGAANWTWALALYYAELFNGFGYRDYRRIRSPYLWAGTNLQQLGKYTSDGRYDALHMDMQIGVVPVMMRMAQIQPSMALGGAWPFALGPVSVPTVAPIKTPMAAFDIPAIQRALNARGFDCGLVDGSFGRKTSAALREFEASKGLVADGLLDPATVAALVGKPANT